eukprot:6214266-Pleurochrysis_carterae.AAC.4
MQDTASHVELHFLLFGTGTSLQYCWRRVAHGGRKWLLQAVLNGFTTKKAELEGSGSSKAPEGRGVSGGH